MSDIFNQLIVYPNNNYEYEISVNFYPINSSHFDSFFSDSSDAHKESIRSLFTPTDVIDENSSLIVFNNQGDLSQYNKDRIEQLIAEGEKIKVSFDIYSPSENHRISSVNQSNLTAILSAIVTRHHAFYADFPIHEPKSKYFDNGVINACGKATYKKVMYLSKSHYLGNYDYVPKVIPVCEYFTDHNSSIVSSHYPYANPVRYANCSSSVMISASPDKSVPLSCLWKIQDQCMCYKPSQNILKEDYIHPVINNSSTIHVKLVSQFMTNGAQNLAIYCDQNPVVLFDSTLPEFSIEACYEAYDSYLKDIASSFATPVVVKEKSSSGFLSNLVSE